MPYIVNAPDGFISGDQGIMKSSEGNYRTFREAKKANIQYIDDAIAALKAYRKEALAEKKSDVYEVDGESQ